MPLFFFGHGCRVGFLGYVIGKGNGIGRAVVDQHMESRMKETI